MKYVTLLGVAVVAAAALTAFAGADTASAKGGVLCSTTTDPCSSTWAKETTLHFSSEESIKLSTTGGVTAATCSIATLETTLTANPDTEGTATSVNEIITWGTVVEPCTKSSTTIALGALRIEQIAGTSNGTVIADSPIKVTMKGLFEGENCVYGFAAGTSIGTLTEGKPATFDASAVAKKFGEEDSCFFGPETTKWTGKYTQTLPTNTTLSVSSS